MAIYYSYTEALTQWKYLLVFLAIIYSDQKVYGAAPKRSQLNRNNVSGCEGGFLARLIFQLFYFLIDDISKNSV